MISSRYRVRNPFSGGFTFIEVMVAMLILVLAVLASATIGDGAVRATRDARDVSTATWLLQGVMTELETKLETNGMDKGCDKKKEGKFEGAFEGFRWVTYCYEVDIKLSQTAAKAAAGGDEDGSNVTQEDQMLKAILTLANDYLGKSLREIHAEVHWNQGKNPRKVAATTHFVRYDEPLVLGGLGGTPANPNDGKDK